MAKRFQIAKKKIVRKIVLNYYFNKELGSTVFYIYVPSTYRENISVLS